MQTRRRDNIEKILRILDDVELFLMSHVSSVSFFIGFILGIASIIIYLNCSLLVFVGFLVSGIFVFEMYRKFYAGEPDFIMHFDKDDFADGGDFSKMMNEIFEEKTGEDD